MSLSILSGPTSNFSPYTRDNAPLWQQLAYAFLGVGTAAQRATAQAKILDRPDITARAKTTDNSAASEVIDLNDRGVTFPAGSFRKINIRSHAVTDNDSWVQEWEQTVWGNDGTTPKLLGTPRLIRAAGEINGTVVRYGSVKYHGTTSGATVTDGADADSGLSLGNFSSGAATLTVPISRNTTTGMRVESAHFSEDAGTIGDLRTIQVRAATSTTFTVNVATTNGTEALADPTGTNNVDIGVYLLPPPSIAVVMNSTHVEVHAGFNASDDVYHDLEVRVGPAETHLHVAD
jgi:hypothetical protein